MTENKRYELIWETDEMCNVFDNDLDVNSTISVEDVVDKLNEYEAELSIEREKVVYWRNKAKDIWGDMRTNVELEKENGQLKNYIDYLEKQNERLKERITELASNDKIVFMNG